MIFENAFGLIWDEPLKLFLINATTYERLAHERSEVRFKLTSGTVPVVYTLSYTAFALTLALLFVDTSTYYFPLKRASSPSQYTLGRAFLQETYITVDYERSNFSISQAYPEGGSTRIVTIPSKSNLSSNTSSVATPNKSQTLSSAAYAGIGVGAGITALIVIGVLVAWRKRLGIFRTKQTLEPYQYLKAELHGDDKRRIEAMEKER